MFDCVLLIAVYVSKKWMKGFNEYDNEQFSDWMKRNKIFMEDWY